MKYFITFLIAVLPSFLPWSRDIFGLLTANVVQKLTAMENEEVSSSNRAGNRSELSCQETAVDDKDWTALFERSAGWLGADGLYSVPVDGNDLPSFSPDAIKNRKTIFIFSDTIYGTLKKNGTEWEHYSMVNHSFSVLTGTCPNKDKILFHTKKAVGDSVISDDSAIEQRNILGRKYWLQDGIVLNNNLYLTAFVFNSKTWKPEQVDLVKMKLNSDLRMNRTPVQINDSFSITVKKDNCQSVFGAAILPGEDGYLYIYGYLDLFRKASRKDLLAARVRRNEIENRAAWEFYNGKIWSKRMEDACQENAVLAQNISAEFSVSPILAGPCRGQYILVYTPGTISPTLEYRIGKTPTGPFGPPVCFYRSKIQEKLGKEIYCYNGKAHPHLSDKDSLLISYNINRWQDIAHHPKEYRPQFVRLKWNDIK